MSLAKNSAQITNESEAKMISHEQIAFYNKHNHCCLCNHKLTVEVQIKSESGTLNEKIHCDHCKVTVSTSEHPLN